MKAFYVVSCGYRRVEAASPREADERDAREHPREGEGFSLVVESEDEAKAILSKTVPHVRVSPSGAVSVTMNGQARP